jgi:zinc protease
MKGASTHALSYWLSVALLTSALLVVDALSASAEGRVSSFALENGMQVVVIPDHRVPVVTHSVWYRVGAADDPWGASGIAHFLEHLMFKSTQKLKSGEFTRIITGMGGRDNALTAPDTTQYFQRVSKEYLAAVMALEADRMTNLCFLEEEVRTEIDVIQEERRSTVDANPVSVLSEQMIAALYQNHPYGRPSLGWAHEMSKLSLDDAATFYRRHYAPNNAVLVVAGDVTLEEVRKLAEATYGRNKSNPAIARRRRPQEPEATAARRVHMVDARIGAPVLLRYYHVPSYATARPGEAESIELLTQILGGDDTSRLYRRLVVEKLASTAGASYQGNGLDSGRIAFLVVARSGIALEKVEAQIDSTIAEIRESGVTQDELDRAKSALKARLVFESDNQLTLARRYGEGVALGRSIADIDAVPGRIEAIGLGDIKRATQQFLVAVRSVAGTMGQSAVSLKSADALGTRQ